MSDSSNQQIPEISLKKVFKIIVLGDSGVGKTCLTYRFCEGQFLEKSEATIGVDFRERNIRINNEDIRLQLWDTAGQERFRKSMVQHYYRNVHAVVIVYDVTKPETFHSIASWMSEVESHGLTEAPRVLVGNKCDSGTPESRLATALAQRLADRHGMPLFETSALLDSECDNVESIFMTLAHKLYSKQPLRVVSVLMFMMTLIAPIYRWWLYTKPGHDLAHATYTLRESLESGEQGHGVVTLQKKSRSANDGCLCS